MRSMRRLLSVLLAGMLVLAAQSDLHAQTHGQQQHQQMQDRIHRMDQQLQRLDRIQERIRQMDQDMTMDMDRVRDRLRVHDPAQLLEHDRLREQDRLRQHERLQATTTALGQMAQQMRGAMMQVRAMEGDPNFDRDPVMQQETERLRLHLQKMCDDVEEGVRLMEQLHQRIRQSAS